MAAATSNAHLDISRDTPTSLTPPAASRPSWAKNQGQGPLVPPKTAHLDISRDTPSPLIPSGGIRPLWDIKFSYLWPYVSRQYWVFSTPQPGSGSHAPNHAIGNLLVSWEPCGTEHGGRWETYRVLCTPWAFPSTVSIQLKPQVSTATIPGIWKCIQTMQKTKGKKQNRNHDNDPE